MNNSFVHESSYVDENVSIGEYVITGANSFKNKDIQSNLKAFGALAQLIGQGK